jgi:hypothetical protein
VARLSAAASLLAIAVLLVVGVGRAGSRPVPLVGVEYSHFAVHGCDLAGTGIIDQYNQSGVRQAVRLQLAAMHSRGLSTLRLIIWHMTRVSGKRWGVLPSGGGRLGEPFRNNMSEFLHDIRSAGFASLLVEFAPMWRNNPFPTFENGRFVNRFDPSKLDENWRFISDVRRLVKRYGPANTWIDPIVEGAPSNAMLRFAGNQIRGYLAEIYSRYVDAFGNADVFISSIAPPEPGTRPGQPDPAQRLQNLIDILRSTRRPLPRVFAVDLPNSRSLQNGDAIYGLQQVDATLNANGLAQPLIVAETLYGDREYAREIATFIDSSPRPVSQVLEWPRTRDEHCSPGLAVSPPYIADAYVRALTGKTPWTTLNGVVRTNSEVELTTSQGIAVTALVAGRYTIRVDDRSRKVGFHLSGPGVRMGTAARFRGRVSWNITLTGGATYGYWSGSRAAARRAFAVLSLNPTATSS